MKVKCDGKDNPICHGCHHIDWHDTVRMPHTASTCLTLHCGGKHICKPADTEKKCEKCNGPVDSFGDTELHGTIAELAERAQLVIDHMEPSQVKVTYQAKIPDTMTASEREESVRAIVDDAMLAFAGGYMACEHSGGAGTCASEDVRGCLDCATARIMELIGD